MLSDRRGRVLLALLTGASLLLTATTAPADELPNATPSAAAPSVPDWMLDAGLTTECSHGRMVVRPQDGFALITGPCSETSTTPAGPAPAGEAEIAAAACSMPGDDHCEAWVADRFDGTGHGQDTPGDADWFARRTIATSPNGRRVFVAGTTDITQGDSNDKNVVLIAYDAATGRRAWASEFLPDGDDATPLSMRVSPDGKTVYVLALMFSFRYLEWTSWLIAFNAVTGEPAAALHQRMFPMDLAVGRAVVNGRAEDRVFVLGDRYIGDDESGKWSSVLAAIPRPAGKGFGKPLWERQYEGVDAHGALGFVVLLSPDGSSVFVGGGLNRADGLRRNFTTSAYRSANGVLLWRAHDTITDPESDFGNNGVTGLAVSPDGSKVFATGIDFFTDADGLDRAPLLTYAHNATTGRRLWRSAYEGSDGEGFHWPSRLDTMGVTGDGATVVVTGPQGRLGGEGTGTVAFAATTGARRWAFDSIDTASRLFTVPAFEPALAMSGDRAYVSSSRGQHQGMSYVTEAYDARNGELVWSARYSGGISYANGIAVNPRGDRLFVTGVTRFLTGDVIDPGVESYDILTIAYDAHPPANDGGGTSAR